MTYRPHLVAARAEVNAQVDLRNGKHVHFIVSAMPRGGFSGGLAVTEGEFALGVVTTSLLKDYGPSELGFFTVLSIEPIYRCLAAHKLLPKCQAEGWNDSWNLETEHFYELCTRREHTLGLRVGASVGFFDDGERFYLRIMCDDRPDLLARMLERSDQCLLPLATRRHDVRPGMVQVHIEQPTAETRTKLEAARQAARQVLLEAGYAPMFSTPSART